MLPDRQAGDFQRGMQDGCDEEGWMDGNLFTYNNLLGSSRFTIARHPRSLEPDGVVGVEPGR